MLAFGLLFKFQQKRWGLQKMVLGFTMIKVSRGQEDEAYLALKNTNGVKEVYRILGEYPLFVIMQAENNIILHRLIDEIKSISSVLVYLACSVFAQRCHAERKDEL